ncbi:MAG: hypothetical protein ACTS78_04560 [Arsenophonus sp. NC-WZS1-MAG3]
MSDEILKELMHNMLIVFSRLLIKSPSFFWMEANDTKPLLASTKLVTIT